MNSDEAREIAELYLYDGDRDRPLNAGYYALLDVADSVAALESALAAALARIAAAKALTGAVARILAKHQLAEVLPGGVACTCGAELAALNPPLDDGAIKGEPLALAVHQLQEMETAR